MISLEKLSQMKSLHTRRYKFLSQYNHYESSNVLKYSVSQLL